MSKQVLRVGSIPGSGVIRCTCGQCHKRAANTPAEFPVEDNLVAAALAAPKPAPLTNEQRNAAITKHNEPLAVVDHAVRTGRDGKMQRNGKAVEPKEAKNEDAQ